MKILISLLLCLFTTTYFNCLYGSRVFKQLTINEGLAHTDANCIMQDSTGLIWIGTYAGLQSYDGYSLQTFNYYQAGQRIFESHNRIYAMACTKEKIWLGTESGLTCFDLNTHNYIPYYIDSCGMSPKFNAPVSQLSVAPSGNYLWIRTTKDMVVAQIKTDTLRLLKWDSEEERIRGKQIINLQFQGTTAWASTGREIIQLGICDEKVTVLTCYKTSELLQKDATVQYIYLQNNFLYMRTENGCYRIYVSGNELHRSTLVYADFHRISPKIPIYTNGKFIVGKDGILWCAYSEGIFEVEHPFSETPSIRKYLQNNRDGALSAQKVKDLLIDKYNNLWVATHSWGIFYHPLSKSFFRNISQVDFSEIGFSQNEIVSVTGQKDGTIWLIVEYANLLKYDPQRESLTKMPLSLDGMQTVYWQNLEMSHNEKYLYIGTNQGVLIYDIHSQTLRNLNPVSSEGLSIDTSVADLYEDSRGRLWIATWGNGIFCIDKPLTAPTITLYLSTKTDPVILSDKISYLFMQGETMYLCTTNGLNRLVLTDTGSLKTLSSYQANKASPSTSLSANYLVGMDCENDSICWIGTIGGGLNRVVLHSEQDNDYTATSYTTQDGLANNDCEIVLLDQLNNVWVGGNGMAQLDIAQNKIHTYGPADGLLNNAFKVNAFYKAQDGTLYMGGLYGLTYFQANHFMHNTLPYTLTLTDLYVNNERIIPQKTYDGNVLLERTLNNTSRLTLNHRQNNFAISFSALGYNLSEQIMYRYRLNGFQEEWNLLNCSNNEIYFSNLPYDTYQLEVQLSTDKGYTWQNTSKILTIKVLSPWYLSGWAKVGYAVAILLIAVLIFRQYNKEQNLKRENEIQKVLIAKDDEKYQAKMQFFMNASHELKTPLTLILLAAERLVGRTQFEKEQNTILYNARKMLALITELVDIRKQDLGIASLNLECLDVSQMVRQLFDETNLWAENKHIHITYSADEAPIKMDADKNKIGKMILNLFSNAIKYTDEGGQIEISLRRGMLCDIKPCYNAKHVEGEVSAGQPLCILTVKDTGVGISSESIRLIYERFFQVEGKTQAHLGSGIGLAIVKSTVLQHQGMIIVSSERMVGSEFIVALPIYHNLPAPSDESIQKFNAESFIEKQYDEFQLDKPTEKVKESAPSNPDLPTLLIVEDNEELQMALKEHFSTVYNICLANNGREGLEMCRSVFPDIIISDVMMPEMDGIEMCRRIKNNLSIAYIPIVLLTAKGDVESQIEGYESGADLYIPKPFSMNLLEVNLRRLLTQRERWFKGKAEILASLSSAVNPEDKVTGNETEVEQTQELENGNLKSQLNAEQQRKLTEKLKLVIEEHLSDPDLSPNQLASELGMSRTKFYRNINRIDGQSLSDYVRNVRLEKAAYLLVHSTMNIQEVMNEVGFINSSHFTKIFKLKFEMTPTEYKRKHS